MKKLKIKADTTLKYLQVFNGILELTYRELQVLSKLIDLSKTVDLCSVINKGAIKKTDNGYELNPLLAPSNKVVIEITNPNE